MAIYRDVKSWACVGIRSLVIDGRDIPYQPVMFELSFGDDGPDYVRLGDKRWCIINGKCVRHRDGMRSYDLETVAGSPDLLGKVSE